MSVKTWAPVCRIGLVSVLGFYLVWFSGPVRGQSEVQRRNDFTRDGKPNVQATSAMAIDWESGKVLYERNADEIRPVASLSKMMAALVIQEDCKLKADDLHVMSATNRDAAKGGDSSHLMTGWSFTHQDLLYMALMKSDNRAVPALGEACQMTPAQFGQKMTEKARLLGLKQTIFVEPTGLSPLNVSTAREMMIILKQVTKVNELARIMTTPKYLVTGYKGGRSRNIVIRNTDRFVMSGSLDILGGKTGYTDLARYCLAVAMQLPERGSVGVVVMGADGKLTRFADVRRIVKWLGKRDAIMATSQEVTGSETPDNSNNVEGAVPGRRSAKGAIRAGEVSNEDDGSGY